MKNKMKRLFRAAYTADITIINSLRTQHNHTFDVAKTQIGVPGNIGPGSQTVMAASSYILGTGTGKANQEILGHVSVGTSATNNFALNAGTLNDVLGSATPTLTTIHELTIELISSTLLDGNGNAIPQTCADGVSGSACTSITIGAASMNPWAGLLGSTGTITLTNGGKFWVYDPAGITVAGTDVLKILNNDGTHSAIVQITIVGVA